MAKLKKYNLAGEALGEATISDELAGAEASSQSVKDYIVAIRHNARQWSACTQTRGEVSHSNQKPHRQKGTGRARQGSLASPQYKGGGVVFGPRPKFDQHVRINKKERRQAIRALLAEKVRNDRLTVLETPQMDTPKTKSVGQFLNKAGIQGRVLFLGAGEKVEVNGKRVNAPSKKHKSLYLSVRNLPKAHFVLAENVSGYDLMRAGSVVVTEEALEQLEAIK